MRHLPRPRYAYGPPPGKAMALGGPDKAQSGTRAVPSLRYLHGIPPFKEQFHFLDGDMGPVGGLTWDGRAAQSARAGDDAAARRQRDGQRRPGGCRRRNWRRHPMRRYSGPRSTRTFSKIRTAPSKRVCTRSRHFEQLPEEFYPYSSRYDAFLRGEIELTAQEERGAKLFKDPEKGNCASCHLGTSRAGTPPPFTDFDFVNVGVPRNPRIARERKSRLLRSRAVRTGASGSCRQARVLRFLSLADGPQFGDPRGVLSQRPHSRRCGK